MQTEPTRRKQSEQTVIMSTLSDSNNIDVDYTYTRLRSSRSRSTMKRIAEKTVHAVDLLKPAVKSAQELHKLKSRVDRYVRQAQLILTWKRGSGAVKMLGSAAKTVGGVMVVAAPLHPKLSMAVNVGHRLWKLGSGLKALNAIANMLRGLWQDGCRSALMDFTHCAAIFSRNVGVFQEVLKDLQDSSQSQSLQGFGSPDMLVSALSDHIPREQLTWAVHIINMVFGQQQYSPLFDFMALSSNPATDSSLLQTVREIESFRFTEFVQESDSKALVTIVNFLHVSRELIDFLDGFNKVTETDCKVLQEYLSKLTEESVSIMNAAILLHDLYKRKGGPIGNDDDNVNNNAKDQNVNENFNMGHLCCIGCLSGQR